jgi:hypothetical protein
MSATLTTLEAAKLLNTTDRTIRRKLSAMSVQCPHLVRYVRKEGKTILIDIRLIYGNFERLQDAPPPPISGQDAPIEDKTESKEQTDLTAVLIEQLSEKDKQINSLQNHIEQLTERNREQNIIIANMQQERQLKLAEPTDKKRTFLQWLFNK